MAKLFDQMRSRLGEIVLFGVPVHANFREEENDFGDPIGATPPAANASILVYWTRTDFDQNFFGDTLGP